MVDKQYFLNRLALLEQLACADNNKQITKVCQEIKEGFHSMYFDSLNCEWDLEYINDEISVLEEYLAN